MKNLLRKPLLYVVIALTTFTYACSDDDGDDMKKSGGGTGGTPTSTLSATINGNTKKAVEVSVNDFQENLFVDGDFESNTLLSESISIGIEKSTEVGSYDFSSAPDDVSLDYFDGEASYSISNGNLLLTSNDTIKKEIIGTFNFITQTFEGDTIKVTDGKFNANY